MHFYLNLIQGLALVSELVKCITMKISYEDLEKEYVKLWQQKPILKECNVGSTVKIAMELKVF